ncbi:hypothetical protein AAC387_Pa11g0754 [Persea americana]
MALRKLLPRWSSQIEDPYRISQWNPIGETKWCANRGYTSPRLPCSVAAPLALIVSYSRLEIWGRDKGSISNSQAIPTLFGPKSKSCNKINSPGRNNIKGIRASIRAYG